MPIGDIHVNKSLGLNVMGQRLESGSAVLSCRVVESNYQRTGWARANMVTYFGGSWRGHLGCDVLQRSAARVVFYT